MSDQDDSPIRLPNEGELGMRETEAYGQEQLTSRSFEDPEDLAEALYDFYNGYLKGFKDSTNRFTILSDKVRPFEMYLRGFKDGAKDYHTINKEKIRYRTALEAVRTHSNSEQIQDIVSSALEYVWVKR